MCTRCRSGAVHKCHRCEWIMTRRETGRQAGRQHMGHTTTTDQRAITNWHTEGGARKAEPNSGACVVCSGRWPQRVTRTLRHTTTTTKIVLMICISVCVCGGAGKGNAHAPNAILCTMVQATQHTGNPQCSFAPCLGMCDDVRVILRRRQGATRTLFYWYHNATVHLSICKIVYMLIMCAPSALLVDCVRSKSLPLATEKMRHNMVSSTTTHLNARTYIPMWPIWAAMQFAISGILSCVSCAVGRI